MSEKEKDIGALWEKRTQKGAPFYSGSITVNGEQIRFVAFKNGYKKEDKHPDFRLFPAKQVDGYQKTAQQQTYSPTGDPELDNYVPQNTGSHGIEYPKDDINPDDIPF